jgi:hypothetical protein
MAPLILAIEAEARADAPKRLLTEEWDDAFAKGYAKARADVLDVEALRKLSDAASHGVWTTGDSVGDRDAIRSNDPTGYDREEGLQTFLVAWCHADARAEEDAAFIVAAVNLVRAILAERQP